MDPMLFRIDWDVLAEVMATIIVLSFFIERALAIVFEYRPFVVRFDKKGYKEPVALIAAFSMVAWLKFDALAILFKLDTNSGWGYLVTAAIIAGGSKASIALFQDLMNAKASVLKEREAEEAQSSGGSTTSSKKKTKKHS